jgi:predicted component of type VI protein secretion system
MTLTWQINDAKLMTVVSDKKPVVIGRYPGCDMVFDDPYVSRMHATIFYKSGIFNLHNLSKTNGILFNDQWDLTHDVKADLRPGDIFEIGETIITVSPYQSSLIGSSMQPKHKVRCSSCGKLLEKSDEDCRWCGASLDGPKTLIYQQVE